MTTTMATAQHPHDPDIKCSACTYWIEDMSFHTGLACGHCRKSKPDKYIHPHKLSNLANAELHPVTDADHWCGEFNYRSTSE